MFLTAPIIGKLFMRSRVWAWSEIKAGKFGPALVRDGTLLVSLDAVERRIGHRFSPEQLRAAGIRVPEEEETHAAI
jgi:hypothetical protein